MIHISTEELFRNIQAEHNCSFIQVDGATGDNRTSEAGATGQAGPDESRRRAQIVQQLVAEENSAARRNSSPCFSGVSPEGRQRLGQDMSSILPATYGNIRDRNNNTSSAPCNEDEVQAVLITGKWIARIARSLAPSFDQCNSNQCLALTRRMRLKDRQQHSGRVRSARPQSGPSRLQHQADRGGGPRVPRAVAQEQRGKSPPEAPSVSTATTLARDD